MRSFNAAILLATVALTIMAVAGGAAAQDALAADDGATEETFAAPKKAPPPSGGAGGAPGLSLPFRPGFCPIRTCGSRCVTRSAVAYYWWYGAPAKPFGAPTGEGGTIVGRCSALSWCRGCYRCRARKIVRTCVRVPQFCKVLSFASAAK